jgi:hypothetical protein
MHPMELLDDMAQVEARFGPFGDSGNHIARWVHICVEHTTGSKIVLDTCDGSPR